MWKLKVGKGEGPWLTSINNFVGRQIWEFEEDEGSQEERDMVEKARELYHQNRFLVKPSSDIFMQMQVSSSFLTKLFIIIIKLVG